MNSRKTKLKITKEVISDKQGYDIHTSNFNALLLNINFPHGWWWKMVSNRGNKIRRRFSYANRNARVLCSISFFHSRSLHTSTMSYCNFQENCFEIYWTKFSSRLADWSRVKSFYTLGNIADGIKTERKLNVISSLWRKCWTIKLSVLCCSVDGGAGNSGKIELNQIKGLRLRQETEAETEAAAQ